jgi:hypothetical protein
MHVPGQDGARRNMADREKTAIVDLKVRMKEALRERIEIAARERGVSLNAEAVRRLEGTFRNDDLLPQLLDLAYGRETAGLLLLLGAVAKHLTGLGAGLAASARQDEAVNNSWIRWQVAKVLGGLAHELAPDEDGAPEAVVSPSLSAEERQSVRTAGLRAVATYLQAAADPRSHAQLGPQLRPAGERLFGILDHPERGDDDAR